MMHRCSACSLPSGLGMPAPFGVGAVVHLVLILIAATASAGSIRPASAAQFTMAAPLDVRRAGQTEIKLPSGHVMVIGGNTITNATSIGSVELYDPVSNEWRAVGSLRIPRHNHTATALPSGKVLVVGGRSTVPVVDSAEIYDPASETWSDAAPLPQALEDHSATLLESGKVLVAGGGWPFAQLYDPAEDAWSPAGTLNRTRFSHTATRLDSGEVMIAGGVAGGSATAHVEIYDPIENTWRVVAPMAEARTAATATLLQSGKVLVVGGSRTGGPLSTTEVFDPATESWTPGPLLREARAVHTATLMDSGRVLVAGGIRSTIVASAEVYDPATSEWTFVGPMLTGRYMHTATALPSGKVLLAGGDNVTALRSVELYDAMTMTAITSVSPEQTVVGAPVEVAFEVTTAWGVPVGRVIVEDDVGTSCGPVVLVAGAGSCLLASAVSGTHAVIARYLPDDGHFEPSISTAVPHSVAPAGTALLVASHLPDPSIPGAPVQVAVQLTVVAPGSGEPTGAIVVSDGVDACSIAEGDTSCEIALTTRGLRVLQADYPGDANFNPGSATAVHGVNRLPVPVVEKFDSAEDMLLVVEFGEGVLSDATDPDGDQLTIANAGTLVPVGLGGTLLLRVDGSFEYSPPADVSGVASFTYVITDGLEKVAAVATITVEALNDPPTIAVASVPEWPAGEAGAKVQPGFATVGSFGPPDEAGQQVQAWIVRTIADPAGVASDVAISNDGTLTYALGGNAGSAKFGVTLQDDGGTANGGDDTSDEQAFTITVAAGLDLSIAIDDDQDFAQGGGTVEYTIVVHNAGPNAAVGARVRNLLPFNLVDASWACTPGAGASCSAGGVGDIDDSVTIPMGATLTYLLGATVLTDPEAPIENSVSVLAPDGVPDADGTNNSATDTDVVGIFADGFGEAAASVH